MPAAAKRSIPLKFMPVTLELLVCLWGDPWKTAGRRGIFSFDIFEVKPLETTLGTILPPVFARGLALKWEVLFQVLLHPRWFLSPHCLHPLGIAKRFSKNLVLAQCGTVPRMQENERRSPGFCVLLQGQRKDVMGAGAGGQAGTPRSHGQAVSSWPGSNHLPPSHYQQDQIRRGEKKSRLGWADKTNGEWHVPVATSSSPGWVVTGRDPPPAGCFAPPPFLAP